MSARRRGGDRRRDAAAIVLMERAGRGGGRRGLRPLRAAQPTLVLCGPGNNGGDGYVVARAAEGARLAGGGAQRSASRPTQDAPGRRRRAGTGATRPLNRRAGAPGWWSTPCSAPGLSRPLDGRRGGRRCAWPRRRSAVVAVDVPSGVPGDTGQPLGPAACAAPDRDLPRARSRRMCWSPAAAAAARWWWPTSAWPSRRAQPVENGPELWLPRFPWPTAASHKHARGRLIVVSGEAWSTGAARLAARAGLRIGAGLVTVLSPPEALPVNAAHLEAVMLQPFETDLELEQAADDVDAAVIGPAAGVGETTLLNVLALARTGAALVLDADAITVFRDDPDELFSLLDRDDVLTPHPGEFERLFPGLLAASPERIAAARRGGRAGRGRGAAEGRRHGDRRAGRPLRRSTPTARPGWPPPAPATCWPASSAGWWPRAWRASRPPAPAPGSTPRPAELHGPGLISEDLPGLAPGVLRRSGTTPARLVLLPAAHLVDQLEPGGAAELEVEALPRSGARPCGRRTSPARGTPR